MVARNNQGNVFLMVVSMLAGISIIVAVLQSDLLVSIGASDKQKKEIVSDFLANAVLDYLVLSVKNVWCVGNQ